MKKVLILIILTLFYPIFSLELSILVVDKDLELPLEGVEITKLETGECFYTDNNGRSKILFPKEKDALLLEVGLIGYQKKVTRVTENSKDIVIELLMDGVIKGNELIVEAEAIGISDDKVGVSTVIDREIIKSSAKIGIVEDVMTAVKILPGVIHSGTMGSKVSVRGGDPTGLTTVIDGFVLKYPYHFDGMFTILNPNIVESIKFSPGIFSVKDGQATSGLLEVNTIEPNDGFKINTIFSTIMTETFIQFPIGKEKKGGILSGVRVTNLTLAVEANEKKAEFDKNEVMKKQMSALAIPPYMNDFYLKAYYNLSERFKLSINTMLARDGVKMKDYGLNMEKYKDEEIKPSSNNNFLNDDFFINGKINMLLTDNLLIDLGLSYEIWDKSIKSQQIRDHFREDIDNSEVLLLDSSTEMLVKKKALQGRADLNWNLNNRVLMQGGVGYTSDKVLSKLKGSRWDYTADESPTLIKTYFDFDSTDGSINQHQSFIYGAVDTSLIKNYLNMEAGVRVDHLYITGKDDYSLNTYPEVAPRINLTFYPKIKNRVLLKNSFSIGAGLFNKIPEGLENLTKELDLANFECRQEKTFMSVMGWETKLPSRFNFKIEGYYKYLYNRFYLNQNTDEHNITTPILNFNGYGRVFGGDLILERKNSRYIDGVLTYTFVHARYNDPNSSGDINLTRVYGEDYWPDFHRFHTLNLLLNIKPKPGFSVITKLGYASGTPDLESGEEQNITSTVTDASGEEREITEIKRSYQYSDTLRSHFQIPLDVKLLWSNAAGDSKVQWYFYFAVQNILGPAISNYQASQDNKRGIVRAYPDNELNMFIPSIGFSLSY